MRSEEKVSSRRRISLRQQIFCSHHVSDRLGHLVPVHRDEPIVKPGRGKVVSGCARLCEFVFMMWESEVKPSAMDVEPRPEIAGCHGGTLNVPAGSTTAPRGFPRCRCRLGIFTAFPERKVTRVQLSSLGIGLIRFDLVGRLPCQLAVIRP